MFSLDFIKVFLKGGKVSLVSGSEGTKTERSTQKSVFLMALLQSREIGRLGALFKVIIKTLFKSDNWGPFFCI